MFPISETVYVIFTDCLTFPILWGAAVFLSVLPFLALLFIIARYRISSVIISILFGGAIALLMAYVVVRLMHGVSWYTDPPNSILLSISQEYWAVGKLFAPAGGIGGLLFWAIAGRHFD